MSDDISEDERRLLEWLKSKPVSGNREDKTYLTAERGSGRYRGKRPRSVRLPGPKPGSIAAVIAELERCGPELSSRRAVRWARQFFSATEVTAWLNAGLTTDDLELIIELRSRGVPAEALQWTVRKESMLDRIRLRGYSAQEIIGILRREGLLPPRSA